MALDQFRIAERLLGQPLTVVEAALDPKRLDVVAERAELVGLATRYAAVGVQDDDTKPRLAMECGGHGGTGVARRRDQNRARRRRFRTQRTQAARQEAGGKVLERCGWTVEQFHHPGRVISIGRRQGFNGQRQVQRVAADCTQPLGQCRAVEERRKNFGRAFGQADMRLEGARIEAGQGGRNIQPAIGRQPGLERLGNAGFQLRVACAGEFHSSSTMRAPGAATGETKASATRPASAKASTIALPADSASNWSTNQPNTVGPAPEIDAPSAPCSSAARLTWAKPGISAARRGSTITSLSPERMSSISHWWQPASTWARLDDWATTVARSNGLARHCRASRVLTW